MLGDAAMHTRRPRMMPVGPLNSKGMPSTTELINPTTSPTTAAIVNGFCTIFGNSGGAFLGFDKSMLTEEALFFSVAIIER